MDRWRRSPADRDDRPSRTEAGVRSFAVLTAALALLASAIVIAGWIAGRPDWQQLFLSRIAIKANTAIGLALLAASLLAMATGRHSPYRRAVLLATGALAALLGVLTAAQYAFRTDLGIDQLFISAAIEAATTATPGRMAAVTAVLLILLGSGFLLDHERDDRRERAAQLLFLSVVAIALTMLLSYAHGAIPTVGPGHGLQIAPATAVLLLAIAVSRLLLRRHTGWMAPIFSHGFGGLTARRLLPFAFLVPLAMMVVRAMGDTFGLETHETTSAATAVMSMLAFAAVIWANASVLERADTERTAAKNERVRLSLEAEGEHARRVAAEEATSKVAIALREKAEAHALLDVLLSGAPVGFALLDADLRFIRVNDAFAAMHRESIDGHIGKRPGEVFKHNVEIMDERLRHVLETGEPVLDLEMSAPSTQGKDRHWLTSIYPLRRANAEVFAVGAVVVETTDRKHLQSQLLQAHKMEAVGQLAGGIAHDFNNLLTVIRTYCSFLEEDLEKDDERKHYAVEIGSAADRAAALTRQLLTFSRKNVIQAHPVHIDKVTASAQRLVARLEGGNIELMMHLAAPDAVVVIDPGQWEQVVMNLAINAGDAMPAGGRLSITSRSLAVDDHMARMTAQLTPGSYVAIEVADTGQGMGAETKARIFEPFFTTKAVGKGTGLGLSIAYGVVREHGGAITVYSEVGQGTAFRVYLPLAEGTIPDAPIDARPPEGGSENILVVDDDDAVRLAVRESLERFGYSVFEASDGARALEISKLLDAPPDLLLTDLMMPEVTGGQLVELLERSGRLPKVLLMSGYADDEIMRRNLADARYPFIQKPFTRDALARKVREILDRPSHASSAHEGSDGT